MVSAPSSESDNCFMMKPVGPANRYISTSGQPLVSFSPSVNAWTGVPMVVKRPQPGARREANADVAAPRVAHPVDGFGETEAVEGLLRCGDALLEG